MNLRVKRRSVTLSLSALTVALMTESIVLLSDTAGSVGVLSQNRTHTEVISRDVSFRQSSSESTFRLFLEDQFGFSDETIDAVRRFDSVREFLARHTEQSGQFVNKMSLDDYVAFGRMRSKPAVLFGPAGECVTVAGVLTDDAERHCVQILDSLKLCSLETVDGLRSAGFREVWAAESDAAPTEYQVGESSATIDHLLITMGLVKPMTDVSAKFQISNNGDSPIVIGRIRPSCGCTSVTPIDEVALPPGESQEFQVRVGSGNTGAFAHRVSLNLSDGSTGASRNVCVLFCGSVLDSFSVTPESLDFGMLDIVDRDPATRIIRIAESVSDRFEITSIESPGPELDPTWQRRSRSDSNRDEYIITARAHAEHLATGEYNGEIVVKTTSSRRGAAVIPFRVRVRSSVEAIPSVSSFGIVEANVKSSQHIAISSRHGRVSDAEIVALPPWCVGEVTRETDDVLLNVVAQADTAGYHFGELRLLVTSDVCTEEITIPCSICVRENKGSS